jgi:hypothetical protein
MNDAPGMPRDFETDTLQRLATLEERTKPKPKTFLEKLQAYGGLIALVIAVGYSWPLGVWDRFIVSQEKAIEGKVGDIRESLTRATGLYVDFGRLQSSIADPEMRDLATRSTANQVLLLITQYDADYAKYRDKLFPEELLIIGLIYQNLYRIEDSLRYFEYVVEHQNTSEIARLEANRQIAKSYMFPSPIQDVVKARNIYKTILQKALQSQRVEITSQAIMIQSEWGLLEMTAGDWQCGVQNMDAAIARLKIMQPLINDRGNMMNLLVSKRQSGSPKPGQPQAGC